MAYVLTLKPQPNHTMSNKYKNPNECPRLAPTRLDKQQIWEMYVDAATRLESRDTAQPEQPEGKSPRIYISGSMTGLPNYNYPAFESAEFDLQNQYPAIEVVNPARFFDGDTSLPRATYLRKDVEELLTCDAIYMLKGWETSKGARLEHLIASELGLHIYYE